MKHLNHLNLIYLRNKKPHMRLVYFVKQTKKVDHNTFDVQIQWNIQFNNKKTVLHLNKLRTQIQTKNLSSMIYGILSYKPCGLIWNGNNYSCGYDALFTICNDCYNYVICYCINTCPCCHDPILHNHVTFPHIHVPKPICFPTRAPILLCSHSLLHSN